MPSTICGVYKLSRGRWLIFLLLLSWAVARPKMAVVIDDFGYSAADARYFTALPYPLTMAVIPGQAYSRSCAQKIAAARRHALLIHFPWTPLGNNPARDYPIRIEPGYSTAKITVMLARAAASVPLADGINNHQGSALSADPVMMERFMSVLREQEPAMYFLDSSTARDSRALTSALRQGIAAARNDLFLDGTQTDAYIEKRFAEAVAIAERRGYVVAICHAGRPATKRVLKKLLNKYNKQVEFVLLPEIMAARRK